MPFGGQAAGMLKKGFEDVQDDDEELNAAWNKLNLGSGGADGADTGLNIADANNAAWGNFGSDGDDGAGDGGAGAFGAFGNDDLDSGDNAFGAFGDDGGNSAAFGAFKADSKEFAAAEPAAAPAAASDSVNKNDAAPMAEAPKQVVSTDEPSTSAGGGVAEKKEKSPKLMSTSPAKSPVIESDTL